MIVENKNILIVGCARSGFAAAKLALSKGAKVSIYDKKSKDTFKELEKQEVEELEKMGVVLYLGKEITLEGYDFVIVSPGVPFDIPLLEEGRKNGKEIIGEIEFAATFCLAPIIAITGTNGETTTTSLVGEIAKAANSKTFVVGNIGTAFSEEINQIDSSSIVVAEVSSFQLESTKTFHPSVSAILNITPDHLNRHKTMENYCKMKYQITKNQTAENYIILNEQDAYFEDAKKHVNGTILTFSSKGKVKRGTYANEGKLYENIDGVDKEICKIEELKLLGNHNIENVLAAIALTVAYGIPLEIIRRVVVEFKGVEHRIEYVCTKKQVDYYNDSKATNTGAAIPGLLSMKKPIRLIAGGMDKKTTFADWIELFEGRVRKVYALGETKEQILKECKEAHFEEIQTFDTFEQAVLTAAQEAQVGECVLLSPACASWDMFESYEQRGDIFKQMVNKLEG